MGSQVEKHLANEIIITCMISPPRHSIGVLEQREPFINISIKIWARLLLCLLTVRHLINNGPSLAAVVLIIIIMLIIRVAFYYGS